MLQLTLGVIGTGNMGGSIISGVISSGLYTPEQIWACNRGPEKLARLQEAWHFKSAETALQVVENSDVIILAVKPQDLMKLLGEISPGLSEGKILVSIAAAINTDQIRRRIPHGVQVVRVMTNTPARVGMGMTLVARGADKGATQAVIHIFQKLGDVVEVEERLMNVGTALSGCGPAFIYEIIEGFVMAGVTEGLSRDVAARLIRQTMKGALELLEQSNLHPAVLRDEVTSPGGTAAAGLAALTAGGLRTVLARGIEVATRAGERLGESWGE